MVAAARRTATPLGYANRPEKAKSTNAGERVSRQLSPFQLGNSQRKTGETGKIVRGPEPAIKEGCYGFVVLYNTEA